MSDVQISNFVNVQITRETAGVEVNNLSIPLILTNEDSGWAGDLIRSYDSLDEVLDDFTSGTSTYAAAAAIFAQSPRVETVKVGAEGTRVAQVQTITFDADIVTGNSINVDVDGTSITQAFDTDHLTTMNALAVQLTATSALGTCTVGGAGNRVITCPAQTAGAPVVIDGVLVTGGASQAVGTVAETVANAGPAEFLNAISEVDDNWYGLIWIERTQVLVEECARYIQGVRKLFCTASGDSNILSAGSTTDIAYRANAANYDRSIVFYNATPADFIDAAFFGKMFTYQPGQATGKFKKLAGITPDNLTSAQRDAATTKKCNVFITVKNIDLTEEGTTAEGEFYDVMRDVDWLTGQLEAEVFNLLTRLPKVPYTDAGVNQVVSVIRKVLQNAAGRSVLSTDPLPDIGDDRADWYTITYPKVIDVSTSDRAARLLPDVKFYARLASAIHKVNVLGTVSI